MRGPGAASPVGEGGQEPWHALPALVPPGAVGGARQRITLSLSVQFGEPGLTQGLNSGV